MHESFRSVLSLNHLTLTKTSMSVLPRLTPLWNYRLSSGFYSNLVTASVFCVHVRIPSKLWSGCAHRPYRLYWRIGHQEWVQPSYPGNIGQQLLAILAEAHRPASSCYCSVLFTFRQALSIHFLRTSQRTYRACKLPLSPGGYLGKPYRLKLREWFLQSIRHWQSKDLSASPRTWPPLRPVWSCPCFARSWWYSSKQSYLTDCSALFQTSFWIRRAGVRPSQPFAWEHYLIASGRQ